MGERNNVLTESQVHGTCREELKGQGKWANPKVKLYIPKCRLIHHFNPYIKVGPFGRSITSCSWMLIACEYNP